MDAMIKAYEAEIRAIMLHNINSDIDQQLDSARTIILLQREIIKALSSPLSQHTEASAGLMEESTLLLTKEAA